MEPERIGKWIWGLGGRRYIMTMGAGVVNTILFSWGTLSESGYITLTGMTIGAYLGSNVIEGFQKKGDAHDQSVAK